MAISQTLSFVLDHFELLTLFFNLFTPNIFQKHSLDIVVMIPKLIEPMLNKDKHYQYIGVSKITSVWGPVQNGTVNFKLGPVSLQQSLCSSVHKVYKTAVCPICYFRFQKAVHMLTGTFD